MEISVMISELKTEAITLGKTLRTKETEANNLRDRLHHLEEEIQTATDRYDAVRMAIDALELIVPTSNAMKPDIPSHTASAIVPESDAVADAEPKKKGRPRIAKRVIKRDAKGVVIGEFSSINMAAKSFGWSHPSMQKYIECTSREKQVRLRGFSLEYAKSEK